jgi:hypothetical protein
VKKPPYVLILASPLAIVVPPVLAHHSFAADYDASKPIMRGTVTKFAWMNPHARFYLDVHLDDGGLVTIGAGIRAGATECLGPVSRESLDMLGAEAVAERMADHLIGIRRCQATAAIHLPGMRRDGTGASAVSSITWATTWPEARKTTA